MKDHPSLWNRIQNILLILLPILILLSLAHTAFTSRGPRRQAAAPDTSPPSLLLTRDENYFVLPGETYEEEGYAAYDDHDGDLTKKVEVSVNGDMVRYRVQDEAGNITIRFRQIPRIDTGFDAPGGSGARKDGSTSDAGGQVLLNPDPTGDVPADKVIYLTFDDGPGQYTERLLGILAGYNVKVTFFVTGAFPAYADQIRSEYEAGHSIGVHSYSHDYMKIYSSDKAFWEDIDQMQSVIEKQTGRRTNLMRFAGGSSNTIGTDQVPGLMSLLIRQAKKKGYQYFDWNVSSGDGAKEIDSSTVISNIYSQIQNHSHSVVLCHDVKKPTVEAMEYFIPWALRNGYVFLPLTPDSEPAHHVVE